MSSLFKHNPVPSKFIQVPVFNPKAPHPCDLFNLINYPPYELHFFVRQHINGPCVELSKLAILTINQAISMLYQVPIVRGYYGEDFVHGVHAELKQQGFVTFINLDDTDVAEEYMRELVVIVAQVFGKALPVFGAYVYYHDDGFDFIAEEQLRKIHGLSIDGRIVWKE